MNLFVVNKAWLFSLFWCAGVDSVTTNDCQLLQQMHYPIWLIVRALTLSSVLVLPNSCLSLTCPSLPYIPLPPYTTFGAPANNNSLSYPNSPHKPT